MYYFYACIQAYQYLTLLSNTSQAEFSKDSFARTLLVKKEQIDENHSEEQQPLTIIFHNIS